MNQEKIGIIISNRRKEQKLTQKELAELLNVSDKTISNWERGKYLPDYSLLLPLCDNLKITVNELLTGKKEEKETIKEVISLVQKNDKITNIGNIIIISGLCFSIYSLTFMKQILNTGFGLFSIIGFIISTYGYLLKTRNYNKKKKTLGMVLFIIIYFLIILFFDLNGIINYNANSMFSYSYSIQDNNKLSQTYLYDLISCNNKNYKIIIHKKNNYENISKMCKNS